MKTIRTKVYSFDELNNDTKVVAIENIRQNYYSDNDFALWAVEDCALFEPLQTELDLIGFDSSKGFLIENTRKSIYFDTDRNNFLDCAIAMEVTNNELFLKWLGITGDLGEKTEFEIYTPNNRNVNTTIEFSEGYDYEFSEKDLIVLESATKKFNNHIQSVLKRIEADIDYRFTDEAITEDILAKDYEFLKSGKQY